ncbi:MAG TPA: T9SS type A sorting domain-containing protein [Chitinophagaceae bacterium]
MKKCYTIVLLCLVSVLTTTAQTRYWVGPASGTEGVWNNTAYWSTSNGGPGGASVPNGPSFDVIFNQGAMVNVDLGAISLNSLTVTNNSTAVLYTGIAVDMTLNSTDAGNPALNIDAGSTLRDSVTAVVNFTTIMASNSRGEIDGTFRLGANPALIGNPNARFTMSNPGSVTNVNSTGRMIFGHRGGGSGAVTTLLFNAGSFLIFERDGGITPTAFFDTNSTILITGNTTQATTLSGSPASVGNIDYNSPALSPVGGTTSMLLNNLTVIKGNFRILNTNNSKLILVTGQLGATPLTVTVQGNMEVSGNSVVTFGPLSNPGRDITFTVNGNFTQNGGAVSLQDFNSLANFFNLSVKGNFTQSSGTFTANSTATSTSNNLFLVELSGTTNQNVSLSSGTIDNANNQVALRINNPAGATLLSPLSVGRMSFGTGILTTTAVNLLTINNTSNAAFVINGVSDNSHVNGPVKRKTALVAVYAFPTGKGGNYRIIEVAPSTLTPSEFTAEYFNSNHPDPDVVLPLTGRSNAEYWVVNRAFGSAAAVYLTLEGAVPNSSGAMEIVVGRYNGSAWQSERGSTGISTFGDATMGTVTSHVMNNFGPFTFAFGPFGALNIKLTTFNAAKASGYNNVHWQAECTSTQAVFEIERSSDGQNFSKIETVVADQVRCRQPFDFQDKTAKAGTNYYRIRVVDVDGKSFYSRIVAVINKSKGFELVGIYPSVISSGQLKVNIASANRDKAELYITNIQGQILKRMQVSVDAGENIIYVDVAGLASGVYHLSGNNSEGQTKTLRFIKQ